MPCIKFSDGYSSAPLNQRDGAAKMGMEAQDIYITVDDTVSPRIKAGGMV